MAAALLAGGGALGLGTLSWGRAEAAKPAAEKSPGAPRPTARSTARPVVDSDVPGPEDENQHVVLPGETLGGVANRTKVPRVLIIEANHLKPPYTLRAGQKLFLPRTRHHMVKAGETGFDIAYRYGVSYSSIAVANGLPPNARLREGQKLLIPTVVKPPEGAVRDGPAATRDSKAAPDARATPAASPDARPDSGLHFLWPLSGRMRRGFIAKSRDGDNDDFHNGLDIVAKEGDTVRTSAPGEVIFAGVEPDSFGNLVVIEHAKGWRTAYGFLSKLTVKRGDMVKAHDRIGLVGHSGRATRDELHFEIRRGDSPVNPLPLLPRREADKPDTGRGDKADDASNNPVEGKNPAAKPSSAKAPLSTVESKSPNGKKPMR